MPLTNPDKVVTEERLAEFYQQILPYLGGMPDVMMSKFSKSDIYSTEERMVGVWHDGKPLYQKTVNISAETGWGSGGTRDYFVSLDVDVLVFDEIQVYNAGENTWYGNGQYFRRSFNTSNGKYRIYNASGASLTWAYGYATIRYTKTTDSAVAIGDDTDYSTTEKIVGTWIDGKPIWQKTIEFVPNAHEYSYNISSLSVETPISVNGIAVLVDNTPVTLDYITPVDIRYGIGIEASPTAIWVNIGNQRSIPSKVIATIQYTKTSS